MINFKQMLRVFHYFLCLTQFTYMQTTQKQFIMKYIETQLKSFLHCGIRIKDIICVRLVIAVFQRTSNNVLYRSSRLQIGYSRVFLTPCGAGSYSGKRDISMEAITPKWPNNRPQFAKKYLIFLLFIHNFLSSLVWLQRYS